MSAEINASLFDPARVSPAIRELNTLILGAMTAGGLASPPESAQGLRDALAAAATPYASTSARTVTLPADGHEISLRVIPAENPTAVFAHVHGGGFVTGSATAQDAALERIVAATGMTAVSIEYRLAPEHPYPAGLDDCERAVRWLIEHGPAELGSGRVLIGGESAGANLALATALRVNRDQPGALSAVALYYGCYDITMTPSQRSYPTGAMLTTGFLDWLYDQYVPDVARRSEPDISPLYADLHGLPPVILAVGTADSLVDDTMFLATRLLVAGVETELVVVPGGDHVFDMAPLPECQEAVAAVDAFLAKHAAS